MIRLAEVEIVEINGKYYVQAPGLTRVRTSLEGIMALIMVDCCESLEDAIGILDNTFNPYDAKEFLIKCARLGIIFQSDRRWVKRFGIESLSECLRRPAFRSLSELNICPSTICNRACSYCRQKPAKEIISIEKIRSLVNAARELGVNTLNILGGEPTCFYDLTSEIINEARTVGIERILVSTNGIELSAPMLREWVNAGLTCLQISVDAGSGSEKNLNDAGPSIRLASKLAPEAVVAYVYHGQHPIHVAREFVKKVRREYMVEVDLKLQIPAEGGSAGLVPTKIRQFVGCANALERNDPGCHFTELRRGTAVWCGAGVTHIYVHADGSVKPCPYVKNCAGNVNNENLGDIWRDLRRWHSFRRVTHVRKERCLKCTLLDVCIGGCKAKLRTRHLTCPWKKSGKIKLHSL